MTKFGPVVLVFLLWSAFAILVHEYASNHLLGACSIAHSHTTIEEAKPQETIAPMVFSVKNAHGASIFNFSKAFVVNNLNGTIDIPTELTGFKDSIYNYLNANQGEELLISSQYLAAEVDSMNGVHYGKERVAFLKNVLVTAGVNADRIVGMTVLSDYNYTDSGTYDECISILFQNVSEQRQVVVEEGISNKTLYSNFAIKEFKPDRTLKGYTIELKNYLAKYPSKKIFIVGHTDSVGEDNYRFGLDRAFNVKSYLADQGVSPSIIVASSKGEDEPIATNANEEGRAKNRRIEITIK
tara:strand:+ start:48954 stop:49844 length:891 start_codon:yes stop_codon:yes gene_type:complete